jgi:hypothetical protein
MNVLWRRRIEVQVRWRRRVEVFLWRTVGFFFHFPVLEILLLLIGLSLFRFFFDHFDYFNITLH